MIRAVTARLPGARGARHVTRGRKLSHKQKTSRKESPTVCPYTSVTCQIPVICAHSTLLSHVVGPYEGLQLFGRQDTPRNRVNVEKPEGCGPGDIQKNTER